MEQAAVAELMSSKFKLLLTYMRFDDKFNRTCKDKPIQNLLNIDNIFDIYNKLTNVNFSSNIDKIMNDDRLDFLKFIKDVNDDDDKSDLIFQCKKKLFDVSTDFFTNQIFQKQETIFTFQFFVNNLFNKVINKYKKENRIDDTDILFLFKGGTTMMILFKTYHKYFLENEDNEYKDFFKRSDSDYQLYINPNKTNFRICKI